MKCADVTRRADRSNVPLGRAARMCTCITPRRKFPGCRNEYLFTDYLWRPNAPFDGNARSCERISARAREEERGKQTRKKYRSDKSPRDFFLTYRNSFPMSFKIAFLRWILQSIFSLPILLSSLGVSISIFLTSSIYSSKISWSSSKFHFRFS